MKCCGKNVATGEPLEVEFGSEIEAVGPAARCEDVYLAPGWIDLQVNGFAGVDYNAPDAPLEEIARSIQVISSTGVARFYPTVITGAPEDMIRALANLARAKESLAEGAAIEGIHVEGPYISPEDGPRGAHPKQWVRPPDVAEFRRFQEAARGHIRLMTLAPEWPSAPAFIEALTADGVVAGIAHTAANARRIGDAVTAGARLSTHLGNGAHSVLPRHPNYLWTQLAEDRLAASFIVDGIHLPEAFLRVAVRAKGLERTVLVTDASSPAGSEPGVYRLGEQEVELTADQRVVLMGQARLAGSALKMNQAVGNLMRQLQIPLADAVRCATVNPARIAGIQGRQRGLTAGDRADFVLFRLEDAALKVQAAFRGGQKVY
jgi:N-acetylglucosamine-6-phosphate deacetylase